MSDGVWILQLLYKRVNFNIKKESWRGSNQEPLKHEVFCKPTSRRNRGRKFVYVKGLQAGSQINFDICSGHCSDDISAVISIFRDQKLHHLT